MRIGKVETKINVRVFTVKQKVVVLLLVGLMTGLAACQPGGETPADTTTTPADTTTSPSPELSPSPEESPS